MPQTGSILVETGSRQHTRPVQGGTLERGAGETAVVEPASNEPPALMRLALDVSLAGFALRVERVEGEVEIMLGRFARVDRAALRFWRAFGGASLARSAATGR